MPPPYGVAMEQSHNGNGRSGSWLLLLLLLKGTIGEVCTIATPADVTKRQSGPLATDGGTIPTTTTNRSSTTHHQGRR